MTTNEDDVVVIGAGSTGENVVARARLQLLNSRHAEAMAGN